MWIDTFRGCGKAAPGIPEGRLKDGKCLEHFAHEMLHGVEQGETEAATPEQPQFTCGVNLRWRRQNTGS